MNATIVILAAGACSRFGACKHLANINGKPILLRLIQHCQHACDWPIVVVTGRYHEPIQATLHNHDSTINILYNADWHLGLGHSIAAATRHLVHCEQLLFLLGDQAALTSDDIATMAFSLPNSPILCADYGPRRGVPARFHRAYFPALQQLQGDAGAKTLLNNDHCRSMRITNAAIDIDTPEDLARITRV